nr:hypothetical protein [Lachnospiraceae bacterium]
VYSISGWMKWKYTRWIRHALALFVVALSVVGLYKAGFIRDSEQLKTYSDSREKNGEIISTNRIINEHDDFTYTILSPVNELRMMELYGYHYESIVLLHKLEHVTDAKMSGRVNIYNDNADDLEDPNIFIPTKYVYIYLEKEPVSVNYNGVDYVLVPDKTGAKIKVPEGLSVSVYSGVNRWVVMSRIKAWVEALEKLYPEAISVYYEDKDFVCYRLIQGSVPYNLGIDYGYNDYAEEFGQSDQ